jgi:hypothetical protein
MKPMPRLTADEEGHRRAEYEPMLHDDEYDEDERRAARGFLAWIVGGATTTIIVTTIAVALILSACAPLDTSSRLAPETSIRPMPRPEARP